MLSETMDLADLLAAASRGDRDAFKALYDRSSAKLFGVVLGIVRNRAAAGEVLQDAYLRIWQNAGRYQPAGGRPMTWMVAVARHAAIDAIRRRTEVEAPPGSEAERAMGNLQASGDLESSVVLQDQLRRCLGQLEPPQRECVVLAYCGGYSREELASHFGRPVPTVKTWLHRSLLALRLCLEAS